MKTILNTNGYEYLVLSEFKDYSLLVNLSSGQFVVAYKIKEYPDGFSWCNGTYFNDVCSAVRFFGQMKKRY